MTASQWLIVVLAVLLANLPFFTRRIFWFGPLPGTGKRFFWRLLEAVAGYFLLGGLAALLESKAHGSVYPQHWEFYAATVFLFMVFAFPGFTVCYLWRERRN